MDLDAALAAAGLRVAEAFVEAEDPSGTCADAQAVRRLLRLAALEITAGSGTPEVWRDLLARLDEALDGYVDTSASGESLVACAGRQLGATLVLLLGAAPGPATPWGHLTAFMEALDESLDLHGEPPVCLAFQDEVARRLEAAADRGSLSLATVDASTDVSVLRAALRRVHEWDRDDW